MREWRHWKQRRPRTQGHDDRMRTLERRIGKLEQVTVASKQEGLLFTVERSDVVLALDSDRCVEILRDCGHLPSRRGLSLLNFLRVPDDLDAQELERYLRDHGDEICNGMPVAGRQR
jgi:hypothetical protein